MSIAAKFKNASKFWKIFLVILAILILAMVITWIVLWNALRSYEATRPTIVMNELVQEIRAGDYRKLVTYSNASGLQEAAQKEFTDRLKSMTEGKEVSFVKAFSSDRDRFPAYTLRFGEEKLAKVTLEHTGNKQAFGFEDYRIKSITDIPIMNASVTVTAPEGYSVFANGNLISDREQYVTEKGLKVKGLESIPDGYFTKPTLVRYTIGDMIEIPEITAKQTNGGDAAVVRNEDGSVCTVLFGSVPDPSEYYSIALAKAKLYSQYVTAWVGQDTFLAQVLPDSPIRNGLASVQTGFYTDHKKDYFTEEKAENLQIYDENCFSCDVSYTQWVEDIRTDHGFKKALPSSFTLYFVKTDGTWYIADLSLR